MAKMVTKNKHVTIQSICHNPLLHSQHGLCLALLSVVIAVGYKLPLNLFVLVLIDLYHLPDGNISNRKCPGCEVCSMVFLGDF